MKYKIIKAFGTHHYYLQYLSTGLFGREKWRYVKTHGPHGEGPYRKEFYGFDKNGKEALKEIREYINDMEEDNKWECGAVVEEIER